MDLRSRPATEADVPGLVLLQERFDTHWFGAPERDEAELRETFDRVAPLPARSRLVYVDDRLAAAGWWWKHDDTTLLVDPDIETPAVHDELVRWLAASGTRHADVLSRDERLRAALARHGGEHWLSQFELMRDAAGLAAPRWPDGVTVSDLGDNAQAVYRVIYDEAGWADIPGHGRRDFEEWQGLFASDDVDPQQQVLAWHDGRLVGVALGRTFSDGVGWVAQVAVPRDQQGRGLGTALLAEAFGRRASAGATRLGLGVSAANADALRLYQSLGLEIDREWMLYRLPG
jgi:ribosomal protein S18 acetylase RimI-like enzyme